jgi:hypothetical protein
MLIDHGNAAFIRGLIRRHFNAAPLAGSCGIRTRAVRYQFSAGLTQDVLYGVGMLRDYRHVDACGPVWARGDAGTDVGAANERGVADQQAAHNP